MAVDGRKIRQSLCQGSDIEHDFPCSPCSKGGKNEAAIIHCVECDENLCQSCIDDHNKFSSMKDHQLLDTVKQPSGRQQELPSQRCEKHGGKLIDVYCPGHDTVCCSTCISVEHSGCKGIIFIPDIACKTDTSQKLKLLETEINTLQARFHAFKQNKQEELENVKKEKGKLIEEIQSERKKINDRLDKMENELLQEADAIFQIKLKRIESNMKEVDARIAVLQESLQKINAAKRENESEKYVQIKRVNEERKTASDCLKDFERPSKTGRLRFDPYRHETGSECNTIGSILHLPAIEVEKCFGEFNVRTADDRYSCDICDMCMCKSGCIVMTDYNNKRIKKMNNAFKVISSLKLSSNPFGICEINSLMLAISVYQGKILLTSQEDPMTVTNSFDVFGACRGIAYNDGRIYVCCDGNRDRSEGPGQIKVFSISGVFQCELSYHGGIELPRRLAFTSSLKGFFVIDGFKGIIHVDKMSGVSNNVGNKISGPSGICNIDKNLFCIAVKSCNLLLMSHDGKDQVEMLIKHAGKTNRSCMCFDNKTSRLVVYHSDSSKVFVYTLKVTD